jgi:hypothetical protein
MVRADSADAASNKCAVTAGSSFPMRMTSMSRTPSPVSPSTRDNSASSPGAAASRSKRKPTPAKPAAAALRTMSTRDAAGAVADARKSGSI